MSIRITREQERTSPTSPALTSFPPLSVANGRSVAPRRFALRFASLPPSNNHRRRQISEAEAAERENIASELSAAREDLVALTAAEVDARMERDKRGTSSKTIVADAQVAEGRRLRRICTTREVPVV